MFALNENEEQFYITEYLKAEWKKNILNKWQHTKETPCCDEEIIKTHL